MPLETIRVDVKNDSRAQVVAQLLSLIAYPNKEHIALRRRLETALVVHAIVTKGEKDPTWANSQQVMKPSILLGQERMNSAEFRKGLKQLWCRLVVADAVIDRHVWATKTGRKFTVGENRLQPTLSNIIDSIKDEIGYKGDSGKTVEADHWAEVKPVAHLAASFMKWLQLEATLNPRLEDTDLLVELLYTERRDRLKTFLAIAENYRKQIPLIKAKFKITEAETIRVAWD